MPEVDFRALVEHAPELVVVLDDGGRVAYANDRLKEFLGHGHEAILGCAAFDFVHPDDLMGVVLGLNDTLSRSGSLGSIPVRLRHANGQWVRFDLEACPLEGGPIGVLVTARVNADRESSELQRISELLRAQQESSPDGILIVSRNSATLSYNRRFLELWRLDEETVQAGYEARAQAVAKLLKEPAAMMRLVEQIYAAPLETFDTNVELNDGRTLEAHTVPLLGPDGHYYARIWYYRDITDRIRADAEVVASEERYRRLVELSPNGIAVHQGGVLRYVNTSGARLFGLPPSELVGENVFAFVHPEDTPRVLQAAMSGDFDIPQFVEVRMMTPGGEELFVEIASATTTFNGQPATQSVFRDITDRRRAELAMRESEERYRSLVESSPDPVVVHDGLDVIYANPAAADFLGFSHPGEVVGIGAFDLLRGVPQDLWLERVNRVMAGETVRVRERRFLVYAGREAELDIAYSPATFGGRRCVQVLIRDLTEIRRAEADRLGLERKLLEAQKLESLGVLAGGVAHDFNNLLVAIMGNAGLASMELTANPVAAAAYLKEVETAAQRAADLARQMLAYAGKGNFVVAPLDMSALVSEMTSLLAASMPRKVSLEYSLPEGLPPVEADATQIRQIVMNLVINAAEAIGDRPGTIRVQSGELTATAEYLSGIYPGGSATPGSFVYLDVIDSGEGMDPTTLARIFEPFFSTKFTGRGLGLAAVLGIVRAHSGALSVSSAPGRGTTFRMLLPVSAAAQGSEPPREPEREAEQHPGLALVVDDEPSVRAVAQAMLHRLGIETIAADSGESALKAFELDGPRLSLVLMDITMPGMPGSRAAEALRERGATLPIVMMSGYTEQDARARCGNEAPSGFLQKPCSFSDMKTVVSAALSATP